MPGSVARHPAPDCAAICSPAPRCAQGHRGLDPSQAGDLGVASALSKRRPPTGRKPKRRGLGGYGKGSGQALGNKGAPHRSSGFPAPLHGRMWAGAFVGPGAGSVRWPGPGMMMKLEGTGLLQGHRRKGRVSSFSAGLPLPALLESWMGLEPAQNEQSWYT